MILLFVTFLGKSLLNFAVKRKKLETLPKNVCVLAGSGLLSMTIVCFKDVYFFILLFVTFSVKSLLNITVKRKKVETLPRNYPKRTETLIVYKLGAAC